MKRAVLIPPIIALSACGTSSEPMSENPKASVTDAESGGSPIELKIQGAASLDGAKDVYGQYAAQHPEAVIGIVRETNFDRQKHKYVVVFQSK